jgi:hypothetical protein
VSQQGISDASLYHDYFADLISLGFSPRLAIRMLLTMKLPSPSGKLLHKRQVVDKELGCRAV